MNPYKCVSLKEIIVFHSFRYWEELKEDKYNDIDDTLRNQFAKLYHRFRNSYDASDTWHLTSSAEAFEHGGDNYLWNTKSRGFATIFDLLQVIVQFKSIVRSTK